MPKIPSNDPLKFLVYRKFPELIALAQDENGLGGVKFPYSEIDDMPTLETHEWPKLPKEAQQYLDDLSSKGHTEIDKIYKEELSQKRAEDDQGRFFNQPNAEADFYYWSKMSEWKMEEALALSFSKDPEVVTGKRLEGILSYTSPFVEKYIKLKELAVRAKAANQFTDATIPMPSDPIRPYKFIQWMQRNEIDFPDELAKKVLRFYEANKPPKNELEKVMDRLEKHSYYKHPYDIGKEQLEKVHTSAKGPLTKKAEKLLTTKQGKVSNSGEIPNFEYTPPYLEFMLQAAKALNLCPEKRARIDDITAWLNENWPSHLEGKSDRIIKSMATLLRRPEDKKGGNTPWNGN